MNSGVTRGGLIGRLADEFDLAWRTRPPVDIEDYYRRTLKGPAGVLDATGRLALLEELIRVDLEYRWRPADKVRARWMVGDYVKRFAELRAGGWNAVSLVAEEFRVRWQWGDRPERAKFVAEHSHLEPHLSPALAGVERSLGVRPAPVFDPPTTEPTNRQTTPSTTEPANRQTTPSTTEPANRQTTPPTARPVDRPTTPPVVDPPTSDKTFTRPPSVPAVHNLAGPVVGGKFAGYHLQRELGRGGMGVVYEAFDPELKRSVALKVILSGVGANGEEIARFRKEAQAVAKLKHDHIVRILQFGEHDGRPFFALEYVPGGTLAHLLRGGPQSAEFATAVLVALADGMAAAHAKEIVHRDLKPGNVLLDHPPGTTPTADRVNPKVTDFGLVKGVDDDQRTMAGQVMGTPAYMAPEQAAGENDRVGPPADVYSLGVILYEMLVGHPPFRGASTRETLLLVRTREPVPPRQLQPTVPPDLETICLKCLRKDPDQRYPSADELGDDLKRFRDGRPILARPVGRVEQAWKFCRRNKVLVATTAGVFALLLIAAVAGVFGAVASAGETEALKKKVTAEAGEAKAVKDKEVAEGKKAVVEGKLTTTEYGLLISATDKELSPHGDSALAERYLQMCDPDKRGWEWHYLMRRLDGERKPLTGHEGGLWSVAVSPDGSEAATASIDGTVRRWDLTAGTSTAPFTQHRSRADTVVRAAEKSGAADVLSGLRGLGREVETTMTQMSGIAPPAVLPDVPDPKRLPKNLTPVLRVAYSPDGKYIASGALDPNVDADDLPKLALAAAGQGKPASASFIGRVLVWTCDGQVVREYKRHKTLVTALAFHPDGVRVASAGMDEDYAWKLWPRDREAEPQAFAGHRGLIGQIRFNGDGTLAATGSTDGTAIVWDVAAGKPKWVFADHHATVHDLAFSWDGKRLATAGMDGTVRVWDLTRPDPTKDPVVLRGHIGSALGVAFSPDGTRVASGGFDRTVRVWDPADGAEKITLRGHTEAVWSVAFDKGGRRLVSASFDGTARVWDSTPLPEGETGRVVWANPADRPDEDHRVNRLAYSKDGKLLAAAGWDRTATLTDAKTGEVKATLPHDGPVWGVAFSPTADRVVTGSWDTTVRVWDVATGKEQTGANGGPFARLKLPVQSVAMSHDGRLIAAGTWDGTIKVWDADTGAERHTFTEHLLPVYDLAFSPDDRHLASAGGDRKAVVRALSGGGKAELTEHTATVFRVAFDRTGKRLAVASWDHTVSLWRFDPARTTADRVLPDAAIRHDDYVYGVAFSPDGKRLATVGQDKTLREWDANTGRPAGDPRTLRGVAWDVTYQPDGERVAAAVWNPKGWVRVWPAAK